MVKVHFMHIFIVGTTHSGSTVLYRLLAYHPEFSWLSQFSFRNGAIPNRKRIPWADFYDQLARKLSVHVWSKNTNASFLVRLFAHVVPCPNEVPEIWNYVFPGLKRRFFTDKDIPEVEQRLKQILTASHNRDNRPHFLAKVPHLAQAIPVIAQIIPTSKFIHILRDGKAVAVSPAPLFDRGSQNALDHIGKRARYWKDTILWMNGLQKELGEDRILSLKFEDLCEDVPGTMQKITDWAGMPNARCSYSRLPLSIPCNNKKRFQETHEKERELILNIIGQTLDVMGYSNKYPYDT